MEDARIYAQGRGWCLGSKPSEQQREEPDAGADVATSSCHASGAPTSITAEAGIAGQAQHRVWTPHYATRADAGLRPTPDGPKLLGRRSWPECDGSDIIASGCSEHIDGSGGVLGTELRKQGADHV